MKTTQTSYVNEKAADGGIFMYRCMYIWESLIGAIFSRVNELSQLCLELTRPCVLICVHMICVVDIVVVLYFFNILCPVEYHSYNAHACHYEIHTIV